MDIDTIAKAVADMLAKQAPPTKRKRKAPAKAKAPAPKAETEPDLVTVWNAHSYGQYGAGAPLWVARMADLREYGATKAEILDAIRFVAPKAETANGTKNAGAATLLAGLAILLSEAR